MSIYGEWKAATIDNGETSSSEVDLGRDFDYMEVQFPTLTSCTIKIQTAEKTSGTFQDLGYGVTSETMTGAYNDTWELGGWQFIKVVSSAGQGAERLIRVRGMRY